MIAQTDFSSTYAQSIMDEATLRAKLGGTNYGQATQAQINAVKQVVNESYGIYEEKPEEANKDGSHDSKASEQKGGVKGAG